MDFNLTSEQKSRVEQAQKFVEQHLTGHATTREREEKFDTLAVQKMGQEGYLTLNVPLEKGGSAWGPVTYVNVIKAFGKACASCTVGMSVSNMVAEAISRLGTDDQCKHFLPQLTAGQFAAFALTESHSGSDAAALKTTAMPTSNGYVLNGNKTFVSSGSYAAFTLVFARTESYNPKKPSAGVTAFLVEKHSPGFSVGKSENKMGLRGSNTVELIFNQCEVPKSALLGEPGCAFSQALTSLNGGRFSVAAVACGIAEAALEASIKYATQRRQFGKPLSQIQSIRNLLADMRVQLDAGWMLTLRAAELKERGEKFSTAASMAKLYATEAANRICRMAIQVHGGVGYTRQYPVERYFRDCKVTTLFEGTSEIQRLVISRSL
jgi:alkylation response protein AidB-like acyl-CoA dehydrogenase